MKQKISDGVQRFSEGTSMHGFSELYNSQHLFWKIFWFITVLASMGLTLYQVVLTTNQYLDQTTNTMISPASSSDIVLPPLKLCYPHWLYWFNFTKADEMGLSPNTTIFALSYLSQMFTTSTFDGETAKKEFFEFYNSKRFGCLKEFFAAFASRDPFNTQLNFSSTGQLDEDPIINCDKLNEEQIRSKITPRGIQAKKRRTSKSTVLNFPVTQPTYGALGAWFNEEELTRYFDRWLFREVKPNKDHNENWQKHFAEGMPLSVFPNAYDDTGFFSLVSDRNYYQVKIKLSVRNYKSTPRVKCASGYRWIEPNSTCEMNCYRKKLSPLFSPPYDFGFAAFFHRDNIFDTYSQTVTHFDLGNTTGIVQEKTYSYIPVRNNTLEDAARETIEKAMNKCKSKCCDANGCQTFTYDTIITSSNVPTLDEKNFYISIEYPTEHETLVMTEQDSQTWEGFVGNVGGLLGIWTGASVLSFIQMFYLCCFADSDGCPLWFWKRKTKSEQFDNSDEKHKQLSSVDYM